MQNNVKAFTPAESDKVARNRKDMLKAEYALIDLATGRAPVVLRVYWPGSVAHACLWIDHGEIQARGAGKAAGAGYCKESAAAHDALTDAGVTLEHPIRGAGAGAILGAVEAIGRHLGIDRFTVHKAHP